MLEVVITGEEYPMKVEVRCDPDGITQLQDQMLQFWGEADDPLLAIVKETAQTDDPPYSFEVPTDDIAEFSELLEEYYPEESAKIDAMREAYLDSLAED